MDALARMPLAFVANRGQTDARVRFYAVGSRYAFYLTRTGVVLSLVTHSTRRSAHGVALDWRFLGANRHVKLERPAAADRTGEQLPRQRQDALVGRPVSRTRRSRIAASGPASTWS